MNKKLKISIVLILGIIVVIVASIYVKAHPCLEMDFDTMRNPTNEENKVNAVNRSRMAADENYVCFSNWEHGVVCYDIEKDRYTIVDTRKNQLMTALQIYDGYLYYASRDDICRVNLKTKAKERIVQYTQSAVDNYFNVLDDSIVWTDYWSGANLKKTTAHGSLLYSESVNGFAILNDYIYYDSIDSGYATLIKQKIDNLEDKMQFPLSEVGEGDIIALLARDNKIYIVCWVEMPVKSELYVLENNEISHAENATFNSFTSFVFYEDYIVGNEGIYSSEWKKLVSFDYPEKLELSMVGGNIYAYSSTPIDLPQVGEGWYRIDIEQILDGINK